MGKFTKKIQVNDSSYNDFIKNQIGKALTDVDVSLDDSTVVKKSENQRRIKVSFGEKNYIPESNSREERITITATPGANFSSADDFLSTVRS